jgi:toxin FitB
MPFLLDTNVISEQTKPQPNKGVLSWLETHAVSETYLSVVTLGEIEQGILLLGDTKRARGYRAWLGKLEHEFTGQILDVNRAVERTWSGITAKAIQDGRTLEYADSLLAATALTHNLTVVTRNTDDFKPVNTINPWIEE